MTMDDGLSALDNRFFRGGEENGGVKGRVDSFFLGGVVSGVEGREKLTKEGRGRGGRERKWREGERKRGNGESGRREGMGRRWKGGSKRRERGEGRESS